MKERRRVFTGRVVSNKMQKTVVVVVERTRRHPLYGKVMRVRNRFKAHTEAPLNVGDTVKITESRPLSREKHWMVSEVVTKGEVLAIPEVVLPPTKSEPPAPPAAEPIPAAGGPA
ncbi:MAG: 30S ribosomal protein S17 [Chloroflexi bacterium]|nr:30S ribosomal protein S17 [Chloroflexota bacterium]MBI3732558.1 30S ribosomal protein S17 [Chloroflexota bacterium]